MCDRAAVLTTAILQEVLRYFVARWPRAASEFSGAELHALIATLVREEIADIERCAAANRPCAD